MHAALVKLYCRRHNRQERFRVKILLSRNYFLEPVYYNGTLRKLRVGYWIKDKEKRIVEFLQQHYEKEADDIRVSMVKD